MLAQVFFILILLSSLSAKHLLIKTKGNQKSLSLVNSIKIFPDDSEQMSEADKFKDYSGSYSIKT